MHKMRVKYSTQNWWLNWEVTIQMVLKNWKVKPLNVTVDPWDIWCRPRKEVKFKLALWASKSRVSLAWTSVYKLLLKLSSWAACPYPCPSGKWVEKVTCPTQSTCPGRLDWTFFEPWVKSKTCQDTENLSLKWSALKFWAQNTEL